MDQFKLTLMRIEREKSPAPRGNGTHDLAVTRHALYRCATTAARSFTINKNLPVHVTVESIHSNS